MNGFISNALAKIARFAVSKAAAFSYAVAVGVAGNLVFHFVQLQVPTPSVLTGSREASQTGEKPSAEPAATAVIVPKPMVAPIPEPPAPAPSAMVSAPAAPPAPPAKPMPTAQLPERPAASLPDPASPSAPVWKPLQLPGAPAASEAAVKPAPAPSIPTQSTATPQPVAPPSVEAANPAPAAVAALPPLGPAIEVGTPPSPPEHTAAPIAAAPPIAGLPAAPPAARQPPRGSLELSDLWHPYRVVKKGLNWAGDQLPVIGGDGDEARPPAAPPPGLPSRVRPAAASTRTTPVSATKPSAPAAPIPLLPPKDKPEAADAAAPPKPVAPGPGSGGLY